MKRLPVLAMALALFATFAFPLSAQQKTKLTVWALNDQKVFLDPIFADFMKANPDVNIEFDGYGTDPMKQALKVAAASKTLPDLWFTWGGSLGSFYVENGMTADLTQIAKAHQWDKRYNKAAIDLVTYNKKVSGVPFHLLAMGLFYPKDVYAKLKLTPPKTFAEFEASLKTMKAAGITPLAFAGKNGWHLMRLTEQVLEHYAGPALHDKLNALNASWKDPAVAKTFAKIKEWADADYFPKGFISLDPTEVENQFFQGSMGYIIEGNWWDGSMIANGFDPNSQDFTKVPTDQKPVRMSSFVEMFQVSAQAPQAQREAAVKLAEYISDNSTIAKYIDTYGGPPTLNAPSSPKAPHVKTASDELAKGNYIISDQALPQEVVQKLFEATDKVVLKEWTPQQAADAMQAAVEAYKKK
jgi:raffinose/stachyose/melibiose transport system substrate-binding protein